MRRDLRPMIMCLTIIGAVFIVMIIVPILRPANTTIAPIEYSGVAITTVDERLSKPVKATATPTPTKNGWQEKYVNARAAAQTATELGDVSQAVRCLQEAAHAAEKLGRIDNEVWQINNAGYALIQEFKARTDYSNKMNTLTHMYDGNDKNIVMFELKLACCQELHLLYTARELLKSAAVLDATTKNTKYENTDRTNSITNNILFIEWVDKFSNAGTL